MALLIHVDGGARGNPGPAGAGVVIRTDDGRLVHEAGYFLGKQTNNAAEYHALIRALQRAQRCPAQPIAVHSDSELLVRQMTGEYQVKSPSLARLHEEVQFLLLKIHGWSIRHIRREENRRADELANLAMDRGSDVVVFDADGDPAASRPEGAMAASGQSAAPPSGGGMAASGQSAALPGDPKAAMPHGTVAMPAAPSSPRARQAVQVTVSRQPSEGNCPVGGLAAPTLTIEHVLPGGLCVHAAHALLPTLLAMLNTDPQEFSGVPTLTVRCSRPGCDAVFQLSPVHGSNGAAHADES